MNQLTIIDKQEVKLNKVSDIHSNVEVIKTGDIQVMSARTGIMSSGFNKNNDQLVKFLYIWLYPKKKMQHQGTIRSLLI